jgi:hypothetical protein
VGKLRRCKYGRFKRVEGLQCHKEEYVEARVRMSHSPKYKTSLGENQTVATRQNEITHIRDFHNYTTSRTPFILADVTKAFPGFASSVSFLEGGLIQWEMAQMKPVIANTTAAHAQMTWRRIRGDNASGMGVENSRRKERVTIM